MARLNDVYIMPFEPYSKYRARDLKFHSSWDWLMPVVEKIESLGLQSEIGRKDCRVYKYLDIMSAETEDIVSIFSKVSKIEAVWLAVIKLILWYNNLKRN